VIRLLDVSIYLGYLVSAVAFVFGIILLSGIAFQYVPSQMRIMFGVVMILLGIYRLVLTRTKARQQNKDEEE
jgi:cadmium resistance protein CadD (predicted permease)